MGTDYLIDSNAVTDYLMGKLPRAGKEFMDLVINEIPNISVITRIEVLSFITPNSELIKDFVRECSIYDLEELIIIQTIALRRQRKIKIPDAIIAATALVNDLTLITHNTSDFEGIPNLKLLDAHSL
ncbi:type II toxin-antitoxin system VapC family toxin [Runella sp.]|uniref:type II toxin-antitoxin system VapC family toxin n=1 Tax=Runella sp. TaxID=1960881 RepID=UPI003D12138B